MIITIAIIIIVCCKMRKNITSFNKKAKRKKKFSQRVIKLFSIYNIYNFMRHSLYFSLIRRNTFFWEVSILYDFSSVAICIDTLLMW